jgi:hypothetical protein
MNRLAARLRGFIWKLSVRFSLWRGRGTGRHNQIIQHRRRTAL